MCQEHIRSANPSFFRGVCEINFHCRGVLRSPNFFAQFFRCVWPGEKGALNPVPPPASHTHNIKTFWDTVGQPPPLPPKPTPGKGRQGKSVLVFFYCWEKGSRVHLLQVELFTKKSTLSISSVGYFRFPHLAQNTPFFIQQNAKKARASAKSDRFHNITAANKYLIYMLRLRLLIFSSLLF